MILSVYKFIIAAIQPIAHTSQRYNLSLTIRFSDPIFCVHMKSYFVRNPKNLQYRTRKQIVYMLHMIVIFRIWSRWLLYVISMCCCKLCIFHSIFNVKRSLFKHQLRCSCLRLQLNVCADWHLLDKYICCRKRSLILWKQVSQFVWHIIIYKIINYCLVYP